MRFPEGYQQRPKRTPVLCERSPYCSECITDLVFDGDEYVCPTCGTAFAPSEDAPGTLYPDWSGEPYPAEVGEQERGNSEATHG